MIIKRFRTEKEAEKFARAFDYARAFSRLKPLSVVRDGDEWGVENPGNVVRQPIPKREPVH